MPRKGKKKLSALEAEASKSSSEKKPRERVSPGLPQQQAPPPQQQALLPQQQAPPPQQQAPSPQQAQQPEQQKGVWSQRQQQQVSQTLPPQQHGAWSQPSSSQQPEARGPPPQQQRPWSKPPLSQQQTAWSQPAQSPPPQQSGAWSVQSQQSVTRGPPASQQTRGRGIRQQQGPCGQPPPQQQGPWGQPPPQQQGPWGQPPPQQQVPTFIGAAGDSKLVTGKASMMPSDMQQATTSAQSQLSQLSVSDPLSATKTSTKTKMSSETMKMYQLAIPRRQNPMKAGTKGRPISVYTNMFEIIFSPNFITNAVHYDVNITPTASKAMYRKIFEQCRLQNFSNRYPAFDGKKNAYSANDLPFVDLMQTEVVIYFADGGTNSSKSYIITLKKVGNIDLNWIKNLRPGLDEADRDQAGIQVLDIIMRHAPESRFLTVGRSLYWDINDNDSLGGGLSLSRGGFSSAVLGWKPYINIDVAHKGFPTAQNVVRLMGELTRARDFIPNPDDVNQRWNREKIERFLKGLKVTYQIPNKSSSKRTYRVNGLGPSAIEHRFMSENKMVSIVEYFKSTKQYNLSYPKLPCLWVGAMAKENKIYLPAELCTIVAAQAVNRKLDEEQTTNMIKQAATSAPVRKQRIEEAFRKINVNDSLTMSQEFRLSIRPEMKQVGARILPPPELEYCKGRRARVNKGIWQMQAFQQPSNLEKGTWSILDLSDFNPTATNGFINEFVLSLMQCASEVGMFIGEPLSPHKYCRSQNTREITEYFNSRANMKLIIVVISDRTDTTYGKVKQITELGIGILTQCIKLRTLKKNSYSAVKNILLKINSKLNGINHTLHVTTMPVILKNNDCMIVGADVTHPSPDAVNIPSIAAVAASSNHSAFQYNIALRLQEPKEEIISDIENIIVSQLRIYENKTSRLPNKIVYYRDGVSEGQLSQVMYFEINAIKRACTRVKANNIQITCLVVQKRHHVRLFPTHEADSDDRYKNVKAGTIVDTEITHPNHIDFYLVSHASIQGTARPTKYRCICNDSNYSEDNIEELTYYLCHMYARCTRAVSYPAPTYYAHLGAYRGRALIQGVDIHLNNLKNEQKKLEMKILSNSPMCFV